MLLKTVEAIVKKVMKLLNCLITLTVDFSPLSDKRPHFRDVFFRCPDRQSVVSASDSAPVQPLVWPWTRSTEAASCAAQTARHWTPSRQNLATWKTGLGATGERSRASGAMRRLGTASTMEHRIGTSSRIWKIFQRCIAVVLDRFLGDASEGRIHDVNLAFRRWLQRDSFQADRVSILRFESSLREPSLAFGGASTRVPSLTTEASTFQPGCSTPSFCFHIVQNWIKYYLYFIFFIYHNT